MQSMKVQENFKCECYGKNICNSLFMANIYDVANSLTEVMMICGIHQCKAKAAVEVIIYSFLHYDEIRHRIDAVPRKRLCKEDLIHDLGRKCLMSRMEAQLTYSIIKRAFKAFYHGTSEGGIRNPILEAQLVHTQECLWVHAAKRTAQVFASYEGMFFTSQKNYELQIRCVYKHLYDRLQKRADPVEIQNCSCKECLRRTIIEDESKRPKKHSDKLDKVPVESSGTLSTESDGILPCERQCQEEASCDETEDSAKKQSSLNGAASPSNQSLNLPRCCKCNCPRLICDCNVDPATGIVSMECSQGPYQCRWLRMDEKEEKPPVPCMQAAENHVCPVDCDETSLICDFECECDCDGVCECAVEDNTSDYEGEEDEFEDKYEEEEVEPPRVRYILPEMSERLPNPAYGGCRVPMNYIIEEVSEQQPTSIAKVENHKASAAIKSEQVMPRASRPSAKSDDVVLNLTSPKEEKWNTNPVSGTDRKLKSFEGPKPKVAADEKSTSERSERTKEEQRNEEEQIMKLIGTLI